MFTENSSQPAGSGESLEVYHLRKIDLLQEQLSRLTILEHPREIQSICNNIIYLKETLRELQKGNKDRHSRSSKS